MPDDAVIIEEARVAADWWAAQLRDPKFNNGEPMHGIMATVLLSNRPEVPGDKVAAFRDAVERRVADVLLARSDRPTPGAWVSVDYGPDRLLTDALDEAGIDGNSRLPWKTTMRVEPGQVTVRHGYGAPEEILYPAARGEGR